MKRIVFKLNETVQVFRLGPTSNKKIAPKNEKIIQSYTFSIDQYNYIFDKVNKEQKPDFKEFFLLDAKNCFDCPFSANSNLGIGKCYTHKLMQYSGFVSMLKSIVKIYGDKLPVYDKEIEQQILSMSSGKYVRFGTYGEPSLHPINLVEKLSDVACSYTGYTHQYFKKYEYLKYFMASCHNEYQAKTVKDKFGGRSFIAINNNVRPTLDRMRDAIIDFNKTLVVCPASNEAGFKSNCSKCGLCSGINGKGKKSVIINQH